MKCVHDIDFEYECPQCQANEERAQAAINFVVSIAESEHQDAAVKQWAIDLRKKHNF